MQKTKYSQDWDFSTIPQEFIDRAFFYEFARQSKMIQRKVVDYRRLHPYFERAQFPSYEPLCLYTNVTDELPPFERDYVMGLHDSFTENDFLHIIDWLSYCPSFPEKPFSSLEEDEIFNGRAVPSTVRAFECISYKLGSGPGINAPVTFGRSFHEITKIPGMVSDHRSCHLATIDWRKPDAEIVADFRDYVKMMRPRTECKPTQSYARGLYNKPIPMPNKCKKKETALEFLGVLRKRNSCKTWKEYMENFCQLEADQRDEEKKVSAANQLISWMESNV